MNTYAWATDIHLDTLGNDPVAITDFGKFLVKDAPHGVFLTGDLSNAKNLVYHLSILEKACERPIYFVLGNHDFYGASVETVRKTMRELTNMSQYLKYLPTTQYVALSPTTALIGHDGWYDGLYGDYKSSRFVMNDWIDIKEFADINSVTREVMGLTPRYPIIVKQAQALAMEAVRHVHDGIKAAVRYHKTIIVLTHFPPFEESHIHNGRVGDPGAQPWYTSKLMGDLLKQASTAYPKVRFEVFCGHTHGKWDGQIAKNLFCHVGGAEYMHPELQTLITVP
jgi:predicted MPP superfamily phosphohydrolase